MTDDQQPAPGAAERRRSTARSAAAKRVRGDFVAQIPKRFSEGFTERIDLIIRIVFMVVVAVGCYLVLEPFLTAILIAAVLAVVTWPVFNKLRSGMRQSSTAAASVMVLSIVVLVLIPLSFLPGQDGADGTYGHVAVVEAVYGDGTFQISEMNWGGPWNMHYRTLTNLGQYWFVH